MPRNTTNDSYLNSWEIYRAHSEIFTDDLNYYFDFAKGHTSLDLFAGYGRVTNHLSKNGISIEAVELNPHLAKMIRLPPDLVHVTDVLTFKSDKCFSRIIAAYNSFCLFTEVDQIQLFFRNLATLLSPGGLVSLNYYDVDRWKDAVDYNFDFNGETVHYHPSYDLSERNKGLGVWIDEYTIKDQTFSHSYKVRTYDNFDWLTDTAKRYGLSLDTIIREFGLPENKVLEPGWIDLVFRRT